jgi:hypothetical protein
MRLPCLQGEGRREAPGVIYTRQAARLGSTQSLMTPKWSKGEFSLNAVRALQHGFMLGLPNVQPTIIVSLAVLQR